MTTSNIIVPKRGDFARWIKGQREARGLNKNQLANMSGVKRTTILMMEQTESDLNLISAYLLMNAMGLNFNDFHAYLEGGEHATDSEGIRLQPSDRVHSTQICDVL